MMQYLHEEQYYIDLYDLFTIKDCLEVVDTFRKIYKKSLSDKEMKDLSEEDRLRSFNQLLNWQLFTTQGERYRRKSERISEMVEEARKKQDFYDKAREPSNIVCNTCGKKLFSDTKILEDYMDSPMRVLFYFPCKTCKTKRAVYNTGEERVSKLLLCPKCSHELIEKHTVKNKGKQNVIITWMRNCPSCKFTETEVDDFEKSHAEWESKQQKDKELLEKYRSEFCFTEEKGKEYIETIEKMKYAKEVFEEEKQKYDNPTYQRSTQLKKISIVDLEKLLVESLGKGNYIKLSLDKPEIGQYVIVPFTVQDADSSRQEHVSTQALEKLIKKALEDSNWRLVSNSLSYRLGYVEGRLKGVEREDDMWELAGRKAEPKPKEENAERRMKYGSDNYVQLARMMGKHEGIENLRKRRLEKEPGGFFLESSEGPYNCGVCGELTPGNRTWWDLDGLRCADCQRNLEENVFPREICKDDKSWIKEWQFQSDYSLHSGTRRKLLREGLLKGRELKRQDGSPYYTIYLVKENQEFFKKYPKKPKMKIEWKTVNDKGDEVKY